jgi:ferredoxin
MKIHADRDVCIGAGMCVTTSAMFDQDEVGIVVIDGGHEVPADQQQNVSAAISLCPSGALRLIAG